jgi:hypothetical protein
LEVILKRPLSNDDGGGNSDTFSLLDRQGRQLSFAGFESSWPAVQRGAFLSETDSSGNVTEVTSFTDGRSAQVQRSSTVGASTITESYLYSYLGGEDPNAGLLSGVILRQKVDGGSWTTLQQVEYTYYTGSETYGGNLGDLMTAVVKDGDDVTLTTTYYRYNDSGRLVLEDSPSAVTGYDDGYPDLLHDNEGDYEYLSNDSGLLTVYEYYTSTTATESTAGGVEGYQLSVAVQQGKEGTPILQSETEYFSRSGGGSTIYPVATETRYRNDNGTGAQATSYSYTWHTGTVQMASLTVTKPVITSQQNGPGTADVEITIFDSAGRTTWQKDAGGFFRRPAGNNFPVPASGGCKSPGVSPGVRGRLFPAGRLTYTAYDETSGTVVKTIVDVDTTQTSDFTDLPSGWSTPTGGGLHLLTKYVVDDQGRTTEIIDVGAVGVFFCDCWAWYCLSQRSSRATAARKS